MAGTGSNAISRSSVRSRAVDNPQRQGENAAIADHESPLNILEDVPNSGGQFNYSPMWDIHFP